MLEHLTGMLGGDGPGELRGAAALRLRVRLQPAGGVGARVMPPTYAGSDGPVYLEEQRRVEDSVVDCVLLDGIASQSNRLEEALLGLLADRRARIPDVVVDQGEFGRHSALEFSHRVFDAWVEDALLDGVPFGKTELFDRLASVINRGVALPLVQHFPVGLLLGCWASRKHNPQGATRLARAVTSEIVGYDRLIGERAASRIDLHHVSSEIPLEANGSGSRFALLPDAKAKPKGVKKPSEFGYGNVTPSAARHGGVTVRFAEQQTVVSLAALRAVRTAELRRGSAPKPASPEQDLVARELLALLALAMLEAQTELGWDLRSGCHLVPEGEPKIEIVGRFGDVLDSVSVIGLGAVEALADRIRTATAAGLAWNVEPVELTASPEQLELLTRSLGKAAEETAEA